jgi:hypothetical protein
MRKRHPEALLLLALRCRRIPMLSGNIGNIEIPRQTRVLKQGGLGMTNKEVPMKRVSCFILAAALVLVASIAAYAAKQLSIQVREVAVKSQPNYLSSTVGSLSYGASIQVSGDEGNWYKIEQPAGYIPKNATGTAKASVDASKNYAAKGVSHDETALAGKGFNPQVEGQYKRSSAALAAAYTQVDKVEAMTVPLPELNQFIAAGQLNK